ncbi:hypothetical protein ACLMVZ_002760 [Klebsiella aerogenes]
MNNELTAALLTIEKCRELSGCPAGVDLQDWVKKLAEENVALKEYRPEPYGIAMMEALDAFFADEEVPERAMMAAFEILCAKRMPVQATDRIVAEIKADGAAEREKTITFTAAKKRTQDGVALIAIGKPYKIHNDDVIGEFFIGERGRYGVITIDRLDYFTTSEEYAWEFSLREGADK